MKNKKKIILIFVMFFSIFLISERTYAEELDNEEKEEKDEIIEEEKEAPSFNTFENVSSGIVKKSSIINNNDVSIDSNYYIIDDGFQYVYTGFEPFDIDKIIVSGTYTKEVQNNILSIKRNGETIKEYYVISLSLNGYTLSHDKIVAPGEFDYSKIVVTKNNDLVLKQGNFTIDEVGKYVTLEIVNNSLYIAFAEKCDNGDFGDTLIASYEIISEAEEKQEYYYQYWYNYYSCSGTRYVEEGTIIEQPDPPEKENAIFDGWYTDSYYMQKYDFSKPITKNLDLYAKWIDFSYLSINYPISNNSIYKGLKSNPYYNTQEGITSEVKNNTLYIKRNNEVITTYDVISLETDYILRSEYSYIDNKTHYIIYVNGDFDYSKVNVITNAATVFYDNPPSSDSNFSGTFVLLDLSNDGSKLEVSLGGCDGQDCGDTLVDEFDIIYAPSGSHFVKYYDYDYLTDVFTVNNGDYLDPSDFPNLSYYEIEYEYDDYVPYGLCTDVNCNSFIDLNSPVTADMDVHYVTSYFSLYPYTYVNNTLFTGIKEFNVSNLFGLFSYKNNKVYLRNYSQNIANIDVVSLSLNGYDTYNEYILVNGEFDYSKINVIKGNNIAVYKNTDPNLSINGKYVKLALSNNGNNLDVYIGNVVNGVASQELAESIPLLYTNANTYYVTFYDEWNNYISTIPVVAGQIVTPPALENDYNNLFVGWCTDEYNCDELFDLSTPINGNLNLYSKREFVYYDGNGQGRLCSDRTIYTYNYKFDIDKFVVPYYIEKEFNNNILTLKLDGNIVAQYDVVYFDFEDYIIKDNYYILSHDGTFDIEKVKVSKSDNVSLSYGPLQSSPNGKDINVNYNINNNSLVVSYSNGDIKEDKYFDILTLTKDSYFVELNIKDLKSSSKNVIKIPVEVKAGDKFEGINLKDYGINDFIIKYYLDENFTNEFDFNTKIYQNYKLYAKTLSIESKDGKNQIGKEYLYSIGLGIDGYIVTNFVDFDINDIVVPTGLTKEYDSNEQQLIIKSGNTIVGVYDVIIMSTEYTNINDKIIADGDIDLSKIHFTSNEKYTSIFTDNYGEKTQNTLSLKTYNDKIYLVFNNDYIFETPEDITNPDYPYINQGGMGDTADSGTGLGVFEIIRNQLQSYTVTWKDSDGTILETDTVYEGATASYDGPQLGNADYRFVGWYLNNTDLFDTSTEINSNIELYAHYDFIERVALTSSVSLIDYGTAIVSFENNISRTFKIRNTGNVALTLNIYNPTGSGPFGSLGFPVGEVINPGEERNITLIARSGGTFYNTPGTYTGNYVITGTSTSNANASVTIPAKIVIRDRNIQVSYTTHVQNVGWQDYVSNGVMAGTEGQSLRLEGIKIKLVDQPYEGNIEYRTHIQNIGWEETFKKNNEFSGTEGQSLRLEAIEIKLTGEIAEHYDVYYRVHAQNFGWLGWARNGERSGTAGYSYRLEGIEIVLIQKGTICAEYGNKETFVDATTGKVIPIKDTALVAYTTHVQNVGWQNYVTDGIMAGTEGQSLRLEGIRIKLVNQKYSGNIEYRTHIQNIGWESEFKKNDGFSGTEGQSLRLEAIEIKLTGEMAEHYDVYYRVHAQNFGWLGWAKKGEQAGTAGYAYRLEGIEILVLPKGEKPSGYGLGQFRFYQK